jgi:hypothetical protein
MRDYFFFFPAALRCSAYAIARACFFGFVFISVSKFLTKVLWLVPCFSGMDTFRLAILCAPDRLTKPAPFAPQLGVTFWINRRGIMPMESMCDSHQRPIKQISHANQFMRQSAQPSCPIQKMARNSASRTTCSDDPGRLVAVGAARQRKFPVNAVAQRIACVPEQLVFLAQSIERITVGILRPSHAFKIFNQRQTARVNREARCTNGILQNSIHCIHAVPNGWISSRNVPD